jgi:hypothetical protein
VSVVAGTVALLLLAAAPAAAQSRELAGGVTFQKWLAGWDDSKGFAIDFAQTLRTTPHTAFALVADLGVNFFPDEETDIGITGGARLRFLPAHRVSPYAQATAGVMHWSETFPIPETGNDPLLGGGAGVQLRLTARFGVKGEYDFWRSWSSRFEQWSWITRVYIAGVIKF